jgi:hypothetical protein
VTAIREGDRITLLGQGGECALLVRLVHPGRDGSVFVSGRHLDTRGRPYARSGRALYLSGPAGGAWDWYTNRKPRLRPVTGRRRLVEATGDGQPTYRRARAFDATATIYIAPPDAVRVEQLLHPSLTLAVDGDGTWTLTVTAPTGEGGPLGRMQLASGSIDRPVPAGDPECEVCGRNDLVQDQPPRCSRHQSTPPAHATADAAGPATAADAVPGRRR